MKKRMSAAALGLRLTALWAAIVILLTAAVQLGLFWRMKYVWGDPDSMNYHIWGFEWILDGKKIALAGKMSWPALLAAVVMPCCSGRNKAVYTLRRLRISENGVTFDWAALFSGYFLLSWAAQLAVVIGMFRLYAGNSGWNAMDLFLTAYRSAYFHTLLPLSEPWGYARNIVLCLSWGTMGSLLARYMRHGGKPFLAVAMVILGGFFLPGEMASASGDIWCCLLMTVLVCIQVWLIREVEAYED